MYARYWTTTDTNVKTVLPITNEAHIVVNIEIRNTVVAMARSWWKSDLHCLLKPIRKDIEPRDKTLPREKGMANLAGRTAIRGTFIVDIRLRSEPTAKQMRNNVNRCG